MAVDPLDRAATVERLTAIAAAGGLSQRALARALELASGSPSPGEWRVFLSRSLLFLGSALMLAGVIFFFAYNWSELGRFARFALLEVAIAGAAASAWQFRRSVAGEVALAAAAVLVGPLLAVYGQTYQTGADAYELFVAWALLILPWVVLARMPSLWLLEIALWNVALPLFSEQRLTWDHGDKDPIWPILAALDGAAWLVAEAVQRRGVAWLRRRWPIRVLAVAAFGFTAPGAFAVVFESDHGEPVHRAGAGLLAVLAAAGYLLSRRPARRDLFILAVSGAAVLAVIGSAIGQFLFDEMDEVVAVLLLALVVLAEVGALVTWLRRMGSAEVDEG